MLPDDHVRVARLVGRVRAGGARAELQSWRRCHTMVERLARWWLAHDRRLGRRQEADDIAQEAWRRFFQGVRDARWTCSDSGRLAALLAVIVRDVAREQAQYDRRQCRDANRTQEMNCACEAVDAHPPPDEGVALADLVAHALGLLDVAERHIVEDWMNDCHWREIGQRNGVTAEAARKRFKRTLTALRRTLWREESRERGGGVGYTSLSACDPLRYGPSSGGLRPNGEQNS